MGIFVTIILISQPTTQSDQFICIGWSKGPNSTNPSSATAFPATPAPPQYLRRCIRGSCRVYNCTSLRTLSHWSRNPACCI